MIDCPSRDHNPIESQLRQRGLKSDIDLRSTIEIHNLIRIFYIFDGSLNLVNGRRLSSINKNRSVHYVWFPRSTWLNEKMNRPVAISYIYVQRVDLVVVCHRALCSERRKQRGYEANLSAKASPSTKITASIDTTWRFRSAVSHDGSVVTLKELSAIHRTNTDSCIESSKKKELFSLQLRHQRLLGHGAFQLGFW
jgi:hypothetical protein